MFVMQGELPRLLQRQSLCLVIKGALGDTVKFWGRQAVQVSCVVRAENVCQSVR